MKTIIRTDERALFFKNQFYKKMLSPGQYRVLEILGEAVTVVKAFGAVSLDDTTIKIIKNDPDFLKEVAAVSVKDNQIAIHRIDDRIVGSLFSGDHYFWSVFEEHTFEILNISTPYTDGIPAEYFQHIPKEFFHKVEVTNGTCMLLYFDKKLEKVLENGVYYFWNSSTKVATTEVDLRIQQMELVGQEILTSDKVSLRINFTCSYKITNPVDIVNKRKDYTSQIYSTVQLALRRYVGQFRLDELLEQKENIVSFVLTNLRKEEDELLIHFESAGLKDIILPGDIRDIMNTVLVAEKTAQANVISRREEVASTRSLLNTAKLMDENNTLRRLKEMEYLERICDKVGTISVSNNGDILTQLQGLTGIK